MSVSVMISAWPSVSDTVYVRSFIQCIAITSTGLYLSIPVLMTLGGVQGHRRGPKLQRKVEFHILNASRLSEQSLFYLFDAPLDMLFVPVISSKVFYLTKNDLNVKHYFILFPSSADRSVGELLKEMDEIKERQRAIAAEEKDVKLMSDYRSPRSPRSPGKWCNAMATTLGSFDFKL